MRLLVCALAFIVLVNSTLARGSDSPEKYQTRYGMLHAESALLNFNDEQYQLVEVGYVHIYGVYQLGSHDIAILGTNCGGSGCNIDELMIAVIDSKTEIRFITDERFYSTDNTVNATVVGDQINIDLGYEEKSQKKATFQNGTIAISLDVPSGRRAFPKSYCKWLYENVISTDCVDSKRIDASCVNPLSTKSMAVERVIKAATNYPDFTEAAFSNSCIRACFSGLPPEYGEFSKEFNCGSN